MYRHVICTARGSGRILVNNINSSLHSVGLRPVPIFKRTIADYASKYADKLQRRAEREGISVSELMVRVKAEEEEQRRQKRAETAKMAAASASKDIPTVDAQKSSGAQSPALQRQRKDKSPIRPLSSILNIPRLLSTPHSPAQVAALWTAYHVSRSGGSGRGYLCAAIPLDIYQKMAGIAQRYTSFVVPVPRARKDSAGPIAEGEGDTAYEFYFMQWDFHGSPPTPSANEDPFENSQPALPIESTYPTNPQTSTILFTPLQEYKMRNSFATPYLVLTQYTDLAATHGIVLLRGEITPSSAGAERYMLSQEDAQLLSMSVQKFYLWSKREDANGAEEGEGARLLRTFHEEPETFKWEELVKYGNWSVQ